MRKIKKGWFCLIRVPSVFHPRLHSHPSSFSLRSAVPVILLTLAIGPKGLAQIPPPRLEASRAPDLVDRREAILRDERAKLPASDLPAGTDGSSRFDPLAEAVSAAELAPGSAPRLEAAAKLFELAISASKLSSPPLAFVDECLRGVLKRDPDHAEARRLLGFVRHGEGGWATPFAASQIAQGKVKEPPFGWVPGDWVAHLKRGELPAPRGSGRWLPADQADALRRDWKDGWTIYTEHFEVHADVKFAEVIAFGRQLETFHQLFFSVMADVVGSELPLARRLKAPGLQPTVSKRPRHQVFFFATRDEYAEYLNPLMGVRAKESLGIYVPKKENPTFGNRSYFFNDVGGQLDVADTLYHEVSHQLLFESSGSTDYAQNAGNFWVFEGLGTYFETVRTLEDGSLRVGGLVGPRIKSAKQRLVDRRELIPLDPFVAMGRAAFQGEFGGDIFLNYAEAMALAVFLMQSQDGRYREPFLDYARDAYKGQFRNRSGRTLEDRLDRKYPDLQREFLEYLDRAGPTAIKN